MSKSKVGAKAEVTQNAHEDRFGQGAGAVAAPEPGSPSANFQKAAKESAEAFDAGLDQLAQRPDAEKPTMSGKRRQRTPAEQRAEIERVAREHEVDLSEEALNDLLRKVFRKP